VTRRALAGDAVTRRAGVRVTTALRTALELARTEPPEEAVVCLDQFLRAGLLTLDALRAAAAELTGPGCRRIRRAVVLADGLAESPQETRLRLVLHASRLAKPIAQHKVFGADGRFVARVDFGWPDARVAVEYEGVWPGNPQSVARNRRRLDELRAAGWTVVFVTASDRQDPVRLVAMVALRAPRYAERQPSTPR
jgi:hypothetical protein